VHLYIAVVDGNGANSDPNTTLTDPFGDDLAVGELALFEGGAVVGGASVPPGRFVFGGKPPGEPSPPPIALPRVQNHSPDGSGRAVALAAALVVALGLLASAMFTRRFSAGAGRRTAGDARLGLRVGRLRSAPFGSS
jgi:hypothetical protein